MLAIRMQRTGRSGHAQFRVIVQDSRFSPKRGRIVSYLGNYDPHTKKATLDSETASRYLQNGAQPSDRVARLFKKEGIKLPAWIKLDEPKKRTVRNPEKRRSTAPEKPSEPKPAAEEPAEPEAAADTDQSAQAEPDQAEADVENSAPQEAKENKTDNEASASEKPTEATAPEEPAAEKPSQS